MKINKDLLSGINVKKINCFKTCCCINDNIVIVNKDNKICDIFDDMFNYFLKDVCYSHLQIEELCNNIQKRMDETYNYYLNLQDKIEEMLYPSYSYYLLIINISKIYHTLNLGRYFLEKCKKVDNVIVREMPYLDRNRNVLELNKAKYRLYIFLLDNWFKEDLYVDYKKYNMNNCELYLFLALISTVYIIGGDNLLEVSKMLKYINCTYSILLKEYENDQKNNQDKFKEEYNDI